MTKAFKMFSNSPAQLKVRKEIDEIGKYIKVNEAMEFEDLKNELMSLVEKSAKMQNLKTDEFNKIEIYDYPYASNNEDKTKLAYGAIELDAVLAWRFKKKDFIIINTNDCAKEKVLNKDMANLILHEYCHLYQLRKFGDWDIEHVNKVLWKKFII